MHTATFLFSFATGMILSNSKAFFAIATIAVLSYPCNRLLKKQLEGCAVRTLSGHHFFMQHLDVIGQHVAL
jgi:hypothetical protein